jgi:SpoIIAA-like
MLDRTLDAENDILFIRPRFSLSESDFAQLAKAVDLYIATGGDLGGIIIEAPTFPGWESIGAMAAHFRFVRDHHKQVRRVALVTDSPLGTAAENLASHFVFAEIKRFGSGDIEAAKQWVLNRL